MSNKTNIEEDIKILKELNVGDDKEFEQAIENILVDRERLEKENEEMLEVKISASAHNRIEELTRENFKLKTELENKRKEYQETYKDVREELKELQDKANKYDSLVQKMEKTFKTRRLKILQENKEPEHDMVLNILQELLDTEKEKI